jgi:hypothetical protein
MCTTDKACYSKEYYPYFQVYVFESPENKYCNENCRRELIKNFGKEFLDNGYYILKTKSECPICLCEDFDLIELSCKHKFCRVCVKTIFDSCTKCPTCKSLIISKTDDSSLEFLGREGLTIEHAYVINTIFKLVCYLTADIDLNQMEILYFKLTDREIQFDINIIQQYLNYYKNLLNE